MVHMSEGQRFITMVREAVASHGTSERRFEDDFGLKKWSLRGLLDPKRSQIPSIDKAREIADALGWEFHIGPSRSAPLQTLSHDGFADPPAIFELPEPLPNSFVKLEKLPDDGVFVVHPDYTIRDALSQEHHWIDAGSYCLVEPEAEIRRFDFVYLEDPRGGVNLGRFLGYNDRQWPILNSHRGMLDSAWNPATLKRLHAITWTGRTPPVFADDRIDTRSTEVLSGVRSALADIEEEIAKLKEIIE